MKTRSFTKSREMGEGKKHTQATRKNWIYSMNQCELNFNKLIRYYDRAALHLIIDSIRHFAN